MDLPIHSRPRDKPRLSRTSVPKVRTGCITCKRRHIKCDEGKPSCTNCLKNRGYCEGYAPRSQSSRSSTASISVAASTPASTSLSLSQSPQHQSYVADPVAQLQLDPDLLDFADDNGMRYFQEFIQLMQGQWMTGISAGDFWSVTVPQLARANNTLRHAAMAVGSLTIWRGQAGGNPSSQGDISGNGDNHMANALTYYGKSLRLPAATLSIHDTLLLSILLLQFETLRGNRQAAIEHVNHGLALFLTILTDKAVNTNSMPGPKPLLKDLASLFLNLETQSRVVLRGKVGRSSPLPNFSKTLKSQRQTIESFSYLANIALIPKNASLEDIPDVFTSLDDYERCLGALQCRQNTIIPIMLEIFRHSGMLETSDHQVIFTVMLQILHDSRIQDFCEQSIEIMKRLDTAFTPLFNKIILKDIDSPEYLRAMQLRLQFLGIFLFDNVPQYLDVRSMKALTPYCYEFLSLAKRIVNTVKRQIRNPAHYMSLQSTLALHLLMIATMCRDPLAREEAIALLKNYPGQDGLWNVKSLYVLALRNRFVEQQNACEDSIDIQWRRLWRREYVFEDGGDRILFTFLAKNDETGDWEVVEEVAQVEGDLENVQWTRRPLTTEGRLLMGSLMPWGSS